MAEEEMDRVRAVERYQKGERVAAIARSMGYTRQWVYKWLERADADDPETFRSRSRRPRNSPERCEEGVEREVVRLRRQLEAAGDFHGAQAVQWELEQLGLRSPSITTINRIFRRHGLVKDPSCRFQSKGKKYPAPRSAEPGDVHQADFVGPRYLAGPIRFYALNAVDVAITRASVTPLLDRRSESVIPAFWSTWVRLGFPKVQQLDNELVFFGAIKHPRSTGQLLRLCLLHDVEPLFIPAAEPWRNGVVEKFNDHWQQKFFHRSRLSTFEELVVGCRNFEARHNHRWKYTRNGGLPPDAALARSKVALRFPATIEPPKLPLPRPTRGRYHFIRFIRGDGQLHLPGERFSVPPEAIYEYVRATIDVAEQALEIRLDDVLIDRVPYRQQR